MLHPMQPSAKTQPSPASSSFAGLLAALALPSRDEEERTSLWSSDDLGEDVATLSYERALRAHARYKPAQSGEWETAHAARPETGDEREESPPGEVGGTAKTTPAGALMQQADDLRRASVTIRLSRAECARLHERAAEAGVTVSAYLRSCTFEAEALRAEVKAALADLRAAGVQGTEGPREQGNKELKQRGNQGMRLARVLVHIGSLCIGLASGKSS